MLWSGTLDLGRPPALQLREATGFLPYEVAPLGARPQEPDELAEARARKRPGWDQSRCPLRAPGWRCPWFRLRLSSLRSQAGGQDPEGLSFGQTASATIRSIELSM